MDAQCLNEQTSRGEGPFHGCQEKSDYWRLSLASSRSHIKAQAAVLRPSRSYQAPLSYGAGMVIAAVSESPGLRCRDAPKPASPLSQRDSYFAKASGSV
jgi:hypothetical protein